jgi:excisionase family DNA binding protein
MDSPWLTAAEAAQYLKRGRRFIRKEINAGRLRAAIIGERKQILTKKEWCDAWVESKVQPMPFVTRRGA